MYSAQLDAVGMGVSVACAVHCVLLPIFFSAVPLLGIEILHNVFLETVTVLLSAIVGSWALYRGYKIHHHKLLPVLLFAVCMAIVVAANFLSAKAEIVLKVIAIPGIIAAHAVNWKYAKACRALH